jgi:glycerol-3-phosphate acyltransferase PlsY
VHPLFCFWDVARKSGKTPLSMNPAYLFLILIPAAYLIGSIPFGLLVGLARGVDVRGAGSGNIGASNVGRLLGKKFFWIVFFLDLFKGLVPSLIAGFLIRFSANDWETYLLWLLVGFAAIFGHMYSIFLKFKGGKGVSTSTGALMGIWPYFTWPALICAVMWVALFKATRYISVASMIGCGTFPLVYVLIGLARGWPVFGAQLPLLIAASLLAILIVYKHRGNIARLRAGTENRAGR